MGIHIIVNTIMVVEMNPLDVEVIISKVLCHLSVVDGSVLSRVPRIWNCASHKTKYLCPAENRTLYVQGDDQDKKLFCFFTHRSKNFRIPIDRLAALADCFTHLQTEECWSIMKSLNFNRSQM